MEFLWQGSAFESLEIANAKYSNSVTLFLIKELYNDKRKFLNNKSNINY